MLNSLDFTRHQIEDLIHLRIPEIEAREYLLHLTPEKITPNMFHQFVEVIRETAIPIPTLEGKIMDCCGTGGSGLPHYNTSTTAAFILAAGGVKVVKFGNRAISSQSGSFDFLEELRIPVHLKLERLPDIVDSCGLAFVYAPQCYPAMAAFSQLRRTLKVRTIFNFLGPLLNPVQPCYRLLGISHPSMQKLMAQYLAECLPPIERAWAVHAILSDQISEVGLDEIGIQGTTHILEIYQQTIQQKKLEMTSEIYQFAEINHTSKENAAIFFRLIQGEDSCSAYHRMSCLNAGAGFYITGQVDSLDEGVCLAEELLAQHKVLEIFNQCRRVYDNCNR